MSLLSVFLGREICGMDDWVGCEHFGQYDAVMNSDDIEAFIDKNAEEFLKEELEAFPPGFRAISVPGDGNCLSHAVSKSCLGVELLYHAMRLELQSELRENKLWYWKKCMPFYDEESATERIDAAIREAVPSQQPEGFLSMAEFLGPIHIHAMANVLRRPIVLMSARTTWERSLAGVYLPERRPPCEWTERSKMEVLKSCSALTEDPTFASSSLCTPFRAWFDKVSELPDPIDLSIASSEMRIGQSRTIGSLCDELSGMLRECALPPAIEGKAWNVHQAIALVRLRSPIFIAWSSAALAHFVCLLPSAESGRLPTQKLAISRTALPQRDGQLTVFGEPEGGLSREDSCKLYLEGGQFDVRGNIWPNRENVFEKVETIWKKAHPTDDFQEEVLKMGWHLLLPNILNNVLDIAQLFKSLNVEDDDDPVWLQVRGTRLLVPGRIEKLANRLPYLTDVLIRASDRMRPIWITSPDQKSILTQGEDFTIEWGTLAKISRMVEKKTGIKLEEQQVDIGWMHAGRSEFSPNIARSIPFHTRKHVWRVPDNLLPGRYWLSVRLISYEGIENTLMEGAGPSRGSFQIKMSQKTLQNLKPLKFKYFKFGDIEVRLGRTVQFTQISLSNQGNAVSTSGVVATNPGGSNPNGEGPENAIDCKVNTKWLDFNKKDLVLEFPSLVQADAYNFMTGNDCPERDPISWKIEVSEDGTSWTLLERQYSETTTDRIAQTEDFLLMAVVEKSLDLDMDATPNAKQSFAETKEVAIERKCDAPLWELYVHGQWIDLDNINSHFRMSVEEANSQKQKSLSYKGDYYVDLEQMKLQIGLEIYPLRRNAKFEIDQEALSTLIDLMGFSEAASRKALEACNNDIDMAVDYIGEEHAAMEHHTRKLFDVHRAQPTL